MRHLGFQDFQKKNWMANCGQNANFEEIAAIILDENPDERCGKK